MTSFAPRSSRALRTAILALAAIALIALVSASLPTFAVGQENTNADAEDAVSGSGASSASVERGRYIANELAMCVQCHSPRSRSGELREDSLFLGAPLPVKSPFRNSPRWAFTAPNLRNVPGYTEEEFLHFMMTGIRPNGTEARGPMPPFRMTREDAQAVHDYLMSL